MNHVTPRPLTRGLASLLSAGPLSHSPAGERLHRRQRLAATFRLFGRAGLDQGWISGVGAKDGHH